MGKNKGKKYSGADGKEPPQKTEMPIGGSATDFDKALERYKAGGVATSASNHGSAPPLAKGTGNQNSHNTQNGGEPYWLGEHWEKPPALRQRPHALMRKKDNTAYAEKNAALSEAERIMVERHAKIRLANAMRASGNTGEEAQAYAGALIAKAIPPTPLSDFRRDENPTPEQSAINSRSLAFALRFAALPKVDLCRPAQVSERISMYLQLLVEQGYKGTFGMLALALGLSQPSLTAIINGAHSYQGVPIHPESADMLRRAYDVLKAAWESNMSEGSMNPVAGIFLGKNFYGMRDKTDVSLSSESSERGASQEELARKYLESLPDGSVL